MPPELIIGIDPGISGGLGVLDLSEPWRSVLMPTPTMWVVRGAKRRQEYNLLQMQLLLVALKGPGRFAVIERGGTRPGQHAMAVYNTGYGVGLWQGLLVGVGMPYQWVSPVVWKKHQGLLRCDKRASRLLVQQRWPSLGAVGPALEGAAEGLLMADWLRSKEGKDGNGTGPGTKAGV